MMPVMGGCWLSGFLFGVAQPWLIWLSRRHAEDTNPGIHPSKRPANMSTRIS